MYKISIWSTIVSFERYHANIAKAFGGFSRPRLYFGRPDFADITDGCKQEFYQSYSFLAAYIQGLASFRASDQVIFVRNLSQFVPIS